VCEYFCISYLDGAFVSHMTSSTTTATTAQ